MWWNRERRAAKAQRQMERLFPDPEERRRVESFAPPRSYEAIVERKLNQLYPEEGPRHQANEALRKYRWDMEVSRVHLAILKLAGSNLDAMKRFVEAANGDPRDVILWAEYPSQSGPWRSLPSEERNRIAEQDLGAYEEWIAADSRPDV